MTQMKKIIERQKKRNKMHFDKIVKMKVTL